MERGSHTHVSRFLRAREKIEDRSSTGKVSVKDASDEVKKGNTDEGKKVICDEEVLVIKIQIT